MLFAKTLGLMINKLILIGILISFCISNCARCQLLDSNFRTKENPKPILYYIKDTLPESILNTKKIVFYEFEGDSILFQLDAKKVELNVTDNGSVEYSFNADTTGTINFNFLGSGSSSFEVSGFIDLRYNCFSFVPEYFKKDVQAPKRIFKEDSDPNIPLPPPLNIIEFSKTIESIDLFHQGVCQ